MITENYVSFETAKLLKEKGFNWECIGYYVVDEPNDIKYSFLGETNSTWESRCCSAPTIQMAMKWLREHGWFIHIDIIREASAWLVDVQDIKNDVAIYPVGKEHSSYEEAVEAAIKYCLENLI